MDWEKENALTPEPETPVQLASPRITRRQALGYGFACLAGAAATGMIARTLLRAESGQAAVGEGLSGVFRGDAPSGALWEAWRKRGWVKEAQHYLKLGRNVQCRVCPNHCLLGPGDRSHCRDKVNMDGTLYTMAYANPCTFHIDPVEKKPLFHFYPGSRSFSLATAGCVFRCLNCQNWEISQKKPEETKSADGAEFRLAPGALAPASMGDMARLSLFPADAVAMAEFLKCNSISYTYSEPVAYYEYTFDTSKLAREKNMRNIMVTCGFIEEKPLRDLGQYLDAAHVDLKGFDEKAYVKLNSGHLQPVLNTLKTLKSMGVWFEIVNLVVPSHTDDPETIKRMCGWLAENIGPDQPLHFSRFHPAHKLTHLPPTSAELLVQARSIAQQAGLRYVYLGNVQDVDNAGTTFCPNCRKAVAERDIFAVTSLDIEHGKCKFCKTSIAGVWGT